MSLATEQDVAAKCSENTAKTHKSKKIPHSITTSLTLQPPLYQLLRCSVIDMIDFSEKRI
jgi:hypothetical protein